MEPDAPEENSVAEAADAIAALLKKKPQDEPDEEEGEASPPEEKPEADKQAADPQLETMKAQAMRAAQDAEQHRQQLAAALAQMVPQLEQALRGEFADVKSPADVIRLASENPARYNRFIAAQNHHAQASAARAQLAHQERQQAQAQMAAWGRDEKSKMGSLVPELVDPEKGAALAQRIQDFALKAGYSPQHLALASATDLAMLHRAMQFEGLEAAQQTARAKAARAPRVYEPGARGEAANRLQSDFERLKKSGSTQDAATVFRNFLT
jgi:hypothetical protein